MELELSTGSKVSADYVTIRIRGSETHVPSVQIDDRTIVATGKSLKIAIARDEELVEGQVLHDPYRVVSQLKSKSFADILTFPEPGWGSKPSYPYFFEWDNLAVARTASFLEWWEGLPQEARKNARRAAKRGVSVRLAKFDDGFVKGIKTIYDEAPVRQKSRFWHFGKDFEAVRMENGTYLDRSEFIGAYLGDELIGFIKLVYVGRWAHIMQILAKTCHYDKRPMNALIVKAVEVCGERGISYLVYSKFTFGNKKVSQLTEFKRRNGFEQMNFPRYYVPLTMKGRIAIKLRLHRGLLGILPSRLIEFLLQTRSKWIGFVSSRLNRRHPEKYSGNGTAKGAIASGISTDP
jgi:hypothetical protein